MNIRAFKRPFVLAVILLIVGIIVLINWCDHAIRSAAENKLYSDTGTIAFNKTGLLLGTAKFLSGGNINLYYNYRIQAAANLLKSGKIKYLIISGDNSRTTYNEPELMRSDLIEAGIDSTRIYLDYAGFRTFDSIIRLQKIFGQDSVTIISQPFHNERAIYIASREGITAIGFNAKDVSQKAGLRVQVREKLARVKVFIDYIFGAKPKFLGEQIVLPS